MTEDVKIRLEDATAPPPQVGFQRRSVPVKLWAAVGAAFLIFEVYLFTAWVVSGDAKPAPLGPDHPSSGYRMFVHIWEISNVVIALAVLYHFIVKPWRRERTVTLEGLLSLVFLLITTSIGLLRIFDLVYNITAGGDGGPLNATKPLVLAIYQRPNVFLEEHAGEDFK